MEEKILKISKILEKWVRLDKSHKGLKDKTPTASYVVSSVLDYPPTKSLAMKFKGKDLGRLFFTTYNLLNGDSDLDALKKSETTYVVDIIEPEGQSYHMENDCDECGGSGEVNCSECDGEETTECGDCGGDGQVKDGDGDDIECAECESSGEQTCDVCSGMGTSYCEECDGSGQTTDLFESINIEYVTLITQSELFIEDLRKRHNPDTDYITDFDLLVKKYIGELIVVDKIFDTIDFEDEWGGGDDSLHKLESISMSQEMNLKIKSSGVLTLLS